MPFDFAALEAARAARHDFDPTHARHRAAATGMDAATQRVKFVRDDYAVAKVYDDGRAPTPVKYNLPHEQADREAGRMRDALSDDELQVCIDERWTYGAVAMKGGRGGNVPRNGKTGEKRGNWSFMGRR